MKHTFFKTLLVVSAGCFLLVGPGCKKLEDFGDTNQNPLTSTEPITAALMTNAQNGLGGIVGGVAVGGVRAGLYCQYFSETQYTDASLYSDPNSDFGIYNTIVQDLQEIINRSTNPATAEEVLGSGSNANQIATATILKVYLLWTVTDRWGDIPYSEALQGAANTKPKFDPQEEIYQQMLEDLETAILTFDNGLPMQGDVMYSGNPAKWKKLANSLRMQIALRMSKRFPNAGDFAATEFAKAVNDPNGYITDNADNFTIPYPGGAAYKHPWYVIYDGRTDYAFSLTIADILATTSDPRVAAFGGSGSPFPYGLTRELAISSSAPTSYALVLANHNDDAPLVVVGASYGLLAHAEAVERGWVTGDAKSLYDQGVTASFDQWGVSGADALLAGKANYNTGVGGGTNVGNSSAFPTVITGQSAATSTALQRIALQQYLAYYPDGIQGWSNWRRTGFPVLNPTALAVNGGEGIPRRYTYGITEYNTNEDNLDEAISRLQPAEDEMSSRMWWDQ